MLLIKDYIKNLTPFKYPLKRYVCRVSISDLISFSKFIKYWDALQKGEENKQTNEMDRNFSEAKKKVEH